MKKPYSTSNKWVLTAGLIALLSTHYIQPAFSNDVSGEFALSSEAETRAAAEAAANGNFPAPDKNQPVSKPAAAKPSAAKPADKPKDAAKPVSKPAPKSTAKPSDKNQQDKTEAGVEEPGACTTGDCNKNDNTKQITVTAEKLQELIDAAVAKALEKKSAQTSEDKSSSTSDEGMTLREKRDQARQDAEDKRVAEFQDKVAAIEDRCGDDLDCLSSRFISLLGRYTGRNALPANIVKTEFNNALGDKLNAALLNSDENAVTALQNLLGDVPTEYKNIKQVTIDAVKARNLSLATEVKKDYQDAQTLAQQNKSAEYLQKINEAQTAEAQLQAEVSGYSQMIVQNLRTSGDMSTLNYYQKSYLPDMSSIAQRTFFNTTTAQPTATAAPQTNTQDPAQTTRINRDGSTTNPSANGNGNSTSANVITEDPTFRKMTVQQPGQNSQWQFQNDSNVNGVQFNAPTPQSRGGARGHY